MRQFHEIYSDLKKRLQKPTCRHQKMCKPSAKTIFFTMLPLIFSFRPKKFHKKRLRYLKIFHMATHSVDYMKDSQKRSLLNRFSQNLIQAAKHDRDGFISIANDPLVQT
ncbi:hypothetical protein BSM4216_3641 [Bacillus smithii]|nr:hypothetical protein BSM4216_3641 [Bacillus smithii]